MGLIKDSSDLYFLTQQQLLDLRSSKESSKVISSIDKSKTRPLGKVIFALGIPHVGRETAQLLAKEFKSIDNLIKADAIDLELLPMLGTTASSSILGWFRNPNNQRMVEKLRLVGVNLGGETSG